MIHRIYSNLNSFKELQFKRGLNLVLAQKSPGATDRQTRNGAGKSSIIDIINFLLGSNVPADSIFRSKKLELFTFGLEIDIKETKYTVERCGIRPNKIVLSSDENISSNFSFVKNSFFKEQTITNDNWKEFLGVVLFSLNQKSGISERYTPKYRSLISYFARREKEGGFFNPTRHSNFQSLGDEQINISFLLGIDWTISQKWQIVRTREKTLDELKKALKEGALGDVIGSVAELRTQVALSDSNINRINNNLADYKILPEYEQLDIEASLLTREIGELLDANSVDKDMLFDLTDAMNYEDHSIKANDINQLYTEAGVNLPNLVQKRIDEVIAFHESIIQNRKEYLQFEVLAAEQRIKKRTDIVNKKEKRKSELLKILLSHGAIEQYLNLQSELNKKEAENEFLHQKLHSAEQISGEKAELDIERRQLLLRLQQDFREQSSLVNEAIITFEKISRSLYENAGNLTISESMNGPQIDIFIPGQKSTGINKMQIFCFDMMLMVLNNERNIGPGFLIHDSHLFDGVDSRQIAKAIQLGEKLSREFNFQYIITMNDDDFPREYLSDFKFNDYLVPVELTDATEDGGLFGFRFE
ncbi:MAG TPA: DUF2326 domain-containing protein [Anaerolineaceae bacterium]|nr:DUF2326 domain-containing protein [Anaerolineaceae bacterium]